MIKWLRLLLLSVVILNISCGKKQAGLNNSVTSGHDGKTTNQSCHGLDLTSNLLTKNTMLKTFECIGWNNEFPNLYQFLQQMEEKEVDLVFGIINERLFSTKSKRDEFLTFVQNQVSQEEVDAISTKLKKLVQSNILNLDLIDLVKREKFELPDNKLIVDVIELLVQVSKKTKLQRQEFNMALKKISEQDIARELKISLVDKAVSKDSMLLKYSSMFIGDSNWIYSYVRNYTTEDIRSLVTYSYLNSNVIKDLSYIENSINLNLNDCSEYSSVFNLNLSMELDERLYVLANSTRTDFLLDVLELSQRFSLFNNICPYGEFNELSSKTLTHLRKYSTMNGGHEFLKKLAQMSLSLKDRYLIFKMIKDESFNDVSTILYKDQVENYNLLNSFIKVIEALSPNDIVMLKEVLFDLGDYTDKGVLSSLLASEQDEKVRIFNFIINDLVLSDSLDTESQILYKFLKEYEHIYTKLKERVEDNRFSFSLWLYKLSNELKNDYFTQELNKFLDKDVFFKLIGFISNKSPMPVGPSSDTPLEPIKIEAQAPLIIKENKLISKCIEKFNEVASEDFNFWNILSEYPKECVELTSTKNLGSYIFQWTIQIDNAFQKISNDRFSYSYGMISPEMMSYYHSLMHIVNTQLSKEDDYVSSTVRRIKEELFEKGLMKVVDNAILTTDYLSKNTTFMSKGVKKLAKGSKEDFDSSIKNVLELLNSPVNRENFDEYDCIENNTYVGGTVCLTEKHLTDFVLKLSDILIRDNGNEKRLYESFAEFLIEEEGIVIPYEARRTKRKSLSIDELVRFLFDMTSKNTKKEVKYLQKNNESIQSLNRAQRLEIVIRDISFLNNFYGSYFMNVISRAKKYYKKVKSMEKNVLLMEKTSEFFRRRNLFPEETKWAFKNIIETYSSLYELDKKHKQPDGSTRRYGNLIQALLTMVVETSSVESKKYSPFQSPKPSLVEKHNGMFITEITKVGGLSHLGLWLRKMTNNDVGSIVNSERFKEIDRHLLTTFSSEGLKKLLLLILEHENREVVVRDFAKYLFKLNRNESNNLLNISKDIMYLASVGFKNGKFDELIPYVKVVLDNYKFIKEHNVFDLNEEFLGVLSKIVNKTAQLPKENITLIAEDFLSILKLIEAKQLNKILKDVKFLDNLSNLKQSIVEYSSTPDYNSGFLTKFLNDSDLNFHEIHNTIYRTYVVHGKKDYMMNIVEVLAHKEKGQTNASYALREIFIEKEDIIAQFLEDMFKKFYRPSHQ